MATSQGQCLIAIDPSRSACVLIAIMHTRIGEEIEEAQCWWPFAWTWFCPWDQAGTGRGHSLVPRHFESRSRTQNRNDPDDCPWMQGQFSFWAHRPAHDEVASFSFDCPVTTSIPNTQTSWAARCTSCKQIRSDCFYSTRRYTTC